MDPRGRRRTRQRHARSARSVRGQITLRELVLVRHGRTAWNVGRRFQGCSDTPLDDEGRAQAQALSLALRDHPIDVIYTSDLERARETAAAIARPHKLEPRSDERLREFDFGRWEGLTWEEILARFPDAAENAPTQARLYRPPGGETFALVRERVARWLNEIGARESGRVVAVTHAGALHAFVDILAPGIADRPGFRFLPASLSRIDFSQASPRVVTINDVEHETGIV